MRCLALGLMLAFMLLGTESALARTVDCSVVSVELPEDWTVLEKPSEDEDGLLAAIFGKNDKTASISLVSGKAEGKDAKELAGLLGPSAGATQKPVEHEGQFGFETRSNGVDGFCIVSSDKKIFLLTCMNGDVPAAAQVVASMKSSRHSDIVPK